MTINLDQLIPQDESCKFKDMSGKEHEFKMFIPFALSVKQDELSKKTGSKKVSDSELQLIYLETVLQPQHDYMTKAWIAENISLPHQNFIYTSIIKKINEGAEAILKSTTKGKKKIFSF